MQKKRAYTSVSRGTVPWYMVLLILVFVAVLFFDFEQRQRQRFESVNDQMEKLASILRSKQKRQGGGPDEQNGNFVQKRLPRKSQNSDFNSGSFRKTPANTKHKASISISQSSDEIEFAQMLNEITADSFSRQNNTHMFCKYAEQQSPEDVYRFIGTVDVTELAEAVKRIPPEVWAEGDERSKKYKVHQYTHTLAFRLSGDHLRNIDSAFPQFEGKISTYDALNFDDSMTFGEHWPEFEPLIQPILDQIAATFPHKDHQWLRVLLVMLDAGKSVSMHRDNGAWMRISRRIHVPILTHEKVTFHVSNEPKGRQGQRGAPPGFKIKEELMPVNTPGNVIELNNAMTHFVNNDAPINRVHLIVDYLADVPNEMTYDEAMCILGTDFGSCLNARQQA
jgi:hypothetical protein